MASSTLTETPMPAPAEEREAVATQAPVPQKISKRAWGVSPWVFDNTKLTSLCIDIAVITGTWAINQADVTRRTYDWLNARYDPWLWTSVLGFAITTAVYWIYGGLYAFADLTGRPKILARYKVQPFQHVTAAQYKQICAIVLRNQLLVSLPVTVILSGPIARWRGMSSSSHDLPGFGRTLGTWMFCLLCEEVGFYYVHRFLHHPSRYARFHKQHHTFTAPVALAATYATMTEHLFSNLVPILTGLVILGSHWSMVVFFFCSLELGTLNTHSGYCIPGLHRSLQHDFHHFDFNSNFGPTGLLDALHGTNKKFMAALAQAEKMCNGDRAAAERKLLHDLAAAGY